MAMICADFSGGEAEELRRAFGFKRSEARMKEIEVKLRRGMARKGITPKAQDEIVQAITSFALYGFPESHAASFALIAYASAYLKVSLPGGVYGGAAEQSTDGFLSTIYNRQGCAASWFAGAAGGCDAVGLVVHAWKKSPSPKSKVQSPKSKVE